MDYNTSSALWSGQAPSPEKSSQVLIREYPHRAIAIVSSTHALILRHSSTTTNTTGEPASNGFSTTVPSARPRGGTTADGPASRCMVEFSPATSHTLADYRPLTAQPIYGTLGLISIADDVFLCVVTHASRAATVRPGETVERILSVQFFCLNTPQYDDVFALEPNDLDSDAASVYGQNLGRRDIPVEHPCQELQKLLSNGSFYYSTDFDLTNRLQDRSVDAATFDIDNFDESFLWNSYMISPLVQFRSRLQEHDRQVLDASRILTSAIRGFCLTIAIPQISAPLRSTNTGLPSYLTVISRLSCRRAGTRFNSRGIDDDGNVANFVETETIYWSPSGVIFSYAQVRGSVPLFWEQTAGLIPGQQKISVTRSPEGAQPAFNKHFDDLEQAYGAVHVINLLSATKPGEVELSTLYREAIRHCPLSRPGEKQSQDHALLRATEYDFHAETRGPAGYEAARGILGYLEDSSDGFAYYMAEDTDDSGDEGNVSRRAVVVLQQEGVFRTNCLDCLDRTNLIQTIVSQMAVEEFLGHRGEFATPDFWMRHSSLWADNGDALSRIYAGTGALKSSFTRHGKMSLAGAIADARKSATRLYINNFADKARQNTIDMLLGRLVGQVPVVLYDPISDFVTLELQKRSSEFSAVEKITLWVGTFNLNGRTTGIDEDLSPWICPPEMGSKQPEIVAVGFQEIVELSPQQIMNSDPGRKQLWEKAVKKTLSSHARKVGGEKYVLLRSGQLVGAALCIFVKASVLHNIRNVEGSVKKTGLSGMAGNKGAVSIRFDYADTPICFVTAHLAAGFANYEERNKDYATIYRGLRFQRNRGVDDHESVIWFGDFNYRIGLGHGDVSDLIRRKDLEGLYANDQLNLQMVAGLAFQFYSEARITFMPTYKFDVGKDEYDTSEKARIPAWTDRILRKGANLRQLSYNSAPLRFSDHRPVYATFECTANIVDEPLRDRISRDIYLRRKADVGHDMANLHMENSDDEDLIGYDSIEPGLPPASSDRQKWWLENGKMARSTVSPPKSMSSSQQTILNPKRPSNPFAPTDEPDWVSVPRSESRLSSFSSMSTSPYEHVNHSTILSTSASNPTPRKLPPPYDPSTLSSKMSRMDMEADASPARSDAPTPPPPRRQTGMTTAPGSRSQTFPLDMTPQIARKPVEKPSPSLPPRPVPAAPFAASQHVAKAKPAPPVAKKPSHLTAPSPTSSGEHVSVIAQGEAPNPHLPPRPSATYQDLLTGPGSNIIDMRGGQVRASNEALPPPVPTKPASSNGMPTGGDRPTSGTGLGIGPVGLSGGYDQPRHRQTARKPVAGPKHHAPSTSSSRAPDLLGDDSNVELSGWEALKPT